MLDLLGSTPMWPCLPQGESLPFFSFFFVPCFLPDFQPCFELVFWQLLRNVFSFDFSFDFLQKGKSVNHTIPTPVCNPIEREPRELKRGEKNRE